MKTKKLLALLMAGAMSVSVLSGCGGSAAKTDDSSADAAATSASAESDVDNVKNNGKLVIGITDFAPMDNKEDGSDEWVGFDADMAKAFAESLGVKAEFIEINWDNKIMELDSKGVDAVWNGMTLTDEVKTSMNCSDPYATNAQVVVVPSDKADAAKDIESIKDMTFADESGSAGEAAAQAAGLNATAVQSQADALMEVAAGTSDACVIDLLMAGAMIGEGTSYPDLTYTDELTTEEYGVGCRKGSDLAAFINNVLAETYADGSMKKVADTYKLADAMVEQAAPDANYTVPTDGDVAYIQNKGKLVVGITEFEPMDYKDASGNWIGFDAAMAKLVAEKLGVDIEFTVINCDNKIKELDSKAIDEVWNGMTLTDEVKNSMECTNPYFNNAQVVVTKAAE